jgi:hypothetical protein
MSRDGAHDFEQRDGVWWCTTENVVSEECEDFDRCASDGCVCNHPNEEA